MQLNCEDVKGSVPKSTSAYRGGSRAAATFKMVCFVIIVNGWNLPFSRSQSAPS